MNFQVLGLEANEFEHLYGLSDKELQTQGVQRYTVDAKPGFPCRVSLVDAEIGEQALLLNYEHLPVNTPYRSRHAIFVREGASNAAFEVNEIPEQLRIRLLSVRAFDRDHMMTDAIVTEGTQLHEVTSRLLGEKQVSYLHVHNAARGCFAAKIFPVD